MTLKTGRMKLCPTCGIEFWLMKCQEPGGSATEKKYCSRKCCPPKAFTAEQRISAFWAKVQKGDGCWTWQGAVTSKWGYGCTLWKGRVLGAHKVAWLITNGDPGALCVLHKCDNRVCVNPSHLFLGTKKDNSVDCKAKDRHARGERTNRTKITETQAREILALKGSIAASEVCKSYNLSPSMVWSIWGRRSWKHLEGTA